MEKFDFSKIEDQKEFDNLPEKERAHKKIEDLEKKEKEGEFIISKKEVGPYRSSISSCVSCEKQIQNQKYYEITMADTLEPNKALAEIDICSTRCLDNTEKNITEWMDGFYDLIKKTGTKKNDERWLKENKDGVEKFFEELQKYYGDGKFQNENIKEILKNKRVLEIGCGAPYFRRDKTIEHISYYPHFCRILKRDYGADPVGIDVNCTINSVVKIDKEVELHCLDAKDVGVKFKPKEFDIVFIYDSTGIDFKNENEKLNYFDGLYKILRQGGLYLSRGYEGGCDESTFKKMKEIGFRKIETDTSSIAGFKPFVQYLIK